MATTVPYNPISSVEPDVKPQSSIRIDAPLAAFGGTVADSIKGLGQSFDKVGSELYDRAVAMQQLNEQAKATAATADFMTQLGDKWAQFKTLEGDAAVAAQPQFIKDLNELRAKQRDSLTSPFAQRAFDNETRMQQARTVMSAAEHSAIQNRKFVSDASEARIKANTVTVLSNPNSPESYEAAVANNNEEVDANTRGQPQTVIDLRKQLVNSELARKRIEAMAESGEDGPIRARAEIEKEIKRGRIVGEDINKARNFVRTKLNARVANTEAEGTVTGSNMAIGERVVSPTQAAEAVGGVENNSRSFQSVEPGKSEGDSLLGKYRVSEQNLGAMLRQAGMPVMNKEQFLADSNAQEQLFKVTFDRLQKEKGSFNAAYEAWREMNPAKTNSTAAELIAANKTLASRASRSELDEAARRRAKLVDDDPELEERTSQAVQLRKTRQLARERDETQRSFQLITERLNDRGENGKLVASEEELLNTPERRAAWDGLQPTQQKAIIRTLEANARGGYSATPENQAKFQGLRGAFMDPNISMEDRDTLLTMNIGALEMPAPQRQALQTLQAGLLRNAIKAPNVSAAMQQLKPTLDALGIDSKNKDDLNAFRGALAGIIQDRMEIEKRPLKPQEIQDIGKELLRDRAYSRFGGLWNTKDKNFKAPVPEKEIPNITAKFKEMNAGREPSEDEIRAVYARMQAAINYQNLYGKKPKVPDRAQ